LEINLVSKEAAKYLRVSLVTLYRWVSAGKIPYRRHGRRLIFVVRELEEWSSKVKKI